MYGPWLRWGVPDSDNDGVYAGFANVLVLTQNDARDLVVMRDAIEAIRDGFIEQSAGRNMQSMRVHIPIDNGVFHIVMGGAAQGSRGAKFGIKANGHFKNANGRHTVSGLMILFDGASGRPAALLDSRLVTPLRTGAITAVAARVLARDGSRSLLLVGAGHQAKAQIDGLAAVLALERVVVFSPTPSHSRAIAEYAERRGMKASTTREPRRAAAEADIIVTITRSTAPILFDSDIPPGTFVSALGADGPGKQELDPFLLSRSRVVVDLLDQCVRAGELRNALQDGVMTERDVYAELGDILAGRSPGRTSEEERFVFDSTGTAIQDVVAASLILEAARARGRGQEIWCSE